MNDNWKDTQRTLIEGTIFQPADDRESVILATLSPAAYTAILSGKNNEVGIGVIEVYDNNQAANSQLAQISTRGLVQGGNDVLIAGFVVGGTGPVGTSILVRALGPSLSAFGISNPLADPVIELRDASGTLIASNNDWKDTQGSAISVTTLQPTDDHESAILTSLHGGAFTAIVGSATGAPGTAVVEVYNLPSP